ncbi:MAG TPA: pyruvate kinase [Vitreimonas sp.]|uniref:pyruvate kinase n=1 Tax=Vitreimonas sp. TaxID=3069702 RepID=UPI002D71B886|nr:pyruvate kinase [Vitreimonas sp.]HYD89364.1 pyruvate kinase [Vitreimonas sp.]
MRTRDCKIVATMGPASDPPERLAMLIEAGVDCFRLNFSHGAREDHARRMQAIRAAEQKAGAPVAVFADLQGPKIRVGSFERGETKLRYNDIVTLEASEELGSGHLIRLPHAELVNALEVGDILKLDDGKMQLTVIERGRNQVKARVDFGGVLKNQKGVNVPTRRIPISALTPKDREDLVYALDLGVDYVALSFVQHPEDVREARALIGERAGIISKIEKPSALEKIDEIVDLSDAVMVARGDLGVELPPEQVPIAQRQIIRAARAAGRPVIVATHMLESMVEAATPTRAEASDVATAVYQGADAVMLSAESAVGRHPQSAVAIMDRIIRAVEADDAYWSSLPRDMTPPQATTADAIALSARHIADVIGCSAVVAFTATGSTALRVARERPRCGVVGLTPVTATARRLALVWGVRSRVTEDVTSVEDMVDKADAAVRALGVAGPDDRVAIIAGIPFGRAGKTNTIRVLRLE